MHTSQFFFRKSAKYSQIFKHTYPYVANCGGDAPISQCYDDNFNISSFAWCSTLHQVLNNTI